MPKPEPRISGKDIIGAAVAVTMKRIDGEWQPTLAWNRWVKPVKGESAGPAVTRIEPKRKSNAA